MTGKIELEIRVNRPRQHVWGALVNDIGQWWKGQDGESLNFVLEPRPGGRLFRDLGHDSGHLWGHVQVIKPPGLLEISGPLMFSNAAVFSHVAFRLVEEGDATLVRFAHSYMGEVDPEFATHANQGWRQFLEEGLKRHAEHS
ncbi:MAG: SRPBCC domain-containing protein [Phycisphaerales bacterium]